MKTTIDLPDALAEEARAVAHRERTTLREIVIAGLRAELSRRDAPAVVDFDFPTVGGHGIAVEIAPAGAIELSYGMRPA